MTTTSTPPATPTTDAEVTSLVEAAAAASIAWAATGRTDRATALETVADHLDAEADALVALGRRETHLAEGRLRGELKRTTFQIRIRPSGMNLRES